MAQVTLSVFLDKHYGSMMHAKRCCEQLEQRLYEIRHQSRITSPQYSSSRVVSSWNRGGAEQTATRIIALEEKIAEMRLTNVAERLVMWKAIYAIEDCRLRLIVGLRYLDGLMGGNVRAARR